MFKTGNDSPSIWTLSKYIDTFVALLFWNWELLATYEVVYASIIMECLYVKVRKGRLIKNACAEQIIMDKIWTVWALIMKPNIVEEELWQYFIMMMICFDMMMMNFQKKEWEKCHVPPNTSSQHFVPQLVAFGVIIDHLIYYSLICKETQEGVSNNIYTLMICLYLFSTSYTYTFTDTRVAVASNLVSHLSKRN